MKELKVKLTFTEPILGTSPANPEIYREFIGSKSPDAATKASISNIQTKIKVPRCRHRGGGSLRAGR